MVSSPSAVLSEESFDSIWACSNPACGTCFRQTRQFSCREDGNRRPVGHAHKDVKGFLYQSLQCQPVRLIQDDLQPLI